MKRFPALFRIWPAAVIVLATAACSGSGNAGSPLPTSMASKFVNGFHHRSSSNPIQHIVIIVQENRSFNNLFYGFKGATTQKYGYESNGTKIELQPVPLETTWDLDHSSTSFFAACNGLGSYPGTDCQMNGFNNEKWYCGGEFEPKCPIAVPPYAYVPHKETKPYFYLGKHYVLADQMYASNFDASSFVSHQYIIAAQASSSVNFPDSYWGCPGGSNDKIDTVNSERQIGSPITVCFDNATIGSEMDTAGLSWGFYTSQVDYRDGSGIWSAYQAIEPIYDGPDWSTDIITPQTDFISDVQNGNLRAVSWVTPTCENSDHAGCGGNTGPSWVASLVNAVGESKYWDNTAIFIFWDDYGGWYDPEAPTMLDYDGLGLRIPMLIVSAYAKKGYVDHTPFEHGSILRFVEDTFGLSQLSASDTRATPPDDAFDFNAPPRKFQAVPSEHGISYFMHQRPDRRPPDDK